MRQNLRRGAAYAVASAASLAISATCIKAAAQYGVPNAVTVFFRSSVGLSLMLPWLLRNGFSGVRTQKLGGHLWRAMFGLLSMYCYFYAIARLSLAEAVLLTYSMPLYVPFIAWLWLREKPSPTSLPSAIVGLIGIALIVKPGVAGFASLTALIGAVSGFAAAMAMVSIRRITNTEPASRVVFYFMLTATAVSSLPLPWSWQMPSTPAWLILVAVGASATLGQLLITKAYASAPAAQIGPFTYSSVVVAGLLGWLLWDEKPDVVSLAGIVLVICSCLLALYPARSRAPQPVESAIDL